VRVDEGRREVKKTKGGAERQDQQERRAVRSCRRPWRTDGTIKFGGLDVLSFEVTGSASVLIRVHPGLEQAQRPC